MNIDKILNNNILTRLSEDDDPDLWTLALKDIFLYLDMDWIWDDVPMPSRIHLIIAKQSHWWRPHGNPPGLYGGELQGMGDYHPPDWEEHLYRDKKDKAWEYIGNTPGKSKGNVYHCHVYFPARTRHHKKASIVQLWKPEFRTKLKITKEEARKKGIYRDCTMCMSFKYLDEKWVTTNI